MVEQSLLYITLNMNCGRLSLRLVKPEQAWNKPTCSFTSVSSVLAYADSCTSAT